MERGLFVTLEGPDGSGKSTIAPLLAKRLIDDGVDLVLTREPGGVKISEDIRSIILDPKNITMDAKTEALLYAAARRQHLIEKVLPALTDGKLVLCERFIDSSLAYQGYGRKIGFDQVYDLNMFAIEEHMPDLTIYFDIDEKTGLERIEKHRKDKDRLDSESLTFHSAVHEGYKEVLRRFKERIIIIDASRSIEEVTQAAYQVLKDNLC